MTVMRLKRLTSESHGKTTDKTKPISMKVVLITCTGMCLEGLGNDLLFGLENDNFHVLMRIHRTLIDYHLGKVDRSIT